MVSETIAKLSPLDDDFSLDEKEWDDKLTTILELFGLSVLMRFQFLDMSLTSELGEFYGGEMRNLFQERPIQGG